MLRSVLFGLAGVAIVVGIGFEWSGLRTRFLGRKRLRFVYATEASPRDEASRVAQGGFESWPIEVRGLKLQTLVSRSEAKAPWIVYFPGNDPEQLKGGKDVLSFLGGAAQLNLLSLSYRGFSGSEGTPEVGEIRDDLVYLTRQLIDQERATELHLVGFSIGGYFAAATTGALTELGMAPKSLTLFAPGYDLVMLRPSRFEKVAPGDDYQVQEFLGQIHCPSLVLQGTKDDAFLGPEQGKKVHAELLKAGGAEVAGYAEFEGLAHEEIHLAPAPLTRAREFVHSKLGG
jgi:pimeloyl-ACP methyl ester carboxylesterase